MDIDVNGFPNVGNNLFYNKEFTVGAMLPVVAPDNTTAPIRREIMNPPVIDGMIKSDNKEVDKYNKDILDDEEKEIYEKAIQEYGNYTIKKSYGIDIKGKNEDKIHYNPIVEIEGYNNRFRGRCEMLVIKDNEVFLRLLNGKKDDATYRVPGGAWDKNESHDQSAKREAEEEAGLVVSNIIFGSKRIFIEDHVQDWVKENVPKDLWWDAYYTETYVGTYSGDYDLSVIDDDDKDDDFIKNGKFYDIDEVWDRLTPDHKEAITKYLGFLSNSLIEGTYDQYEVEYVKNRSEIDLKDFGVPEERKYPLDSKRRVISAIKLFNHVDKKYEKELAHKIIKKAKEYDIDLSFVGDKNRLKNYISNINERVENVMMDLNEIYFEEKVSDSNKIPDDIESAIDTLEEKGYDVKYSSAGYSNTRFDNDRNKDGVINDKLVSTARVIFSRDYSFKTTPEGWEWRVLDNGSKALYVKPFTYNDKYGSEREAFEKWRRSYLQNLRSWANDLPNVSEDKKEEE